MLERLSPISLKCFNAAKHEAKRLESAELNTTHLLLGLLQHQKGWMAGLLKPYGVSTDQMTKAVRKSLEQGSRSSSSRLVVSAELKAALKHGIALAKRTPVTPVHLMIASLGAGPAVRRLLDELGVDVTRLVRDLGAADGEQSAQQIPVAEPPAEAPEQPATAGDGGPTAAAGVPEKRIPHKPTPTLDQYGRDLTRLAEEIPETHRYALFLYASGPGRRLPASMVPQAQLTGDRGGVGGHIAAALVVTR